MVGGYLKFISGSTSTFKVKNDYAKYAAAVAALFQNIHAILAYFLRCASRVLGNISIMYVFCGTTLFELYQRRGFANASGCLKMAGLVFR